MRSELLIQLREAGITSIECDYSGDGDDGQIDEITAEGGELSQFIDHSLMDFFWDITQDHYEGFHNGDGGSGTITWDITTDAITLEHQTAVMEYHDQEPITIEAEIGA